MLRSTSQVREEQFGLLFYSSLGPKLLFAETGTALSCEFFSSNAVQKQVMGSLSDDQKTIVLNFLRQLVKKGFAYEQ
nr:mycofactocin biosynthesis chaperone MftB [uncultured Desulfobacter sp.]